MRRHIITGVWEVQPEFNAATLPKCIALPAAYNSAATDGFMSLHTWATVLIIAVLVWFLIAVMLHNSKR